MGLTTTIPAGKINVNGLVKDVVETTITYPANTTTYDEVTPDGKYINKDYGTPYPPVTPPGGRVRVRFVQTTGADFTSYSLVLREPKPARLPQAAFNWLKIVTELRITSGPYAGSFRYGENNGISWYFDNVGLYNLCADLVPPNAAEDLILPHLNLFVANLLSDYTIKNVAADLTTLTGQDADDSNAAVFIILVEQWLRITGNWGWLKFVHGNPALPSGQTNQEMLVELAHNNITAQFKTVGWVATNDPTAKASGLPSVFQYGNAPGGGKYSFGLLEDSAECEKALRLLGQLLVDLGDPNGPLYLQHAINLANTIHGLYNIFTNDWAWNDGQVDQTGTFTVDSSTGLVTVTGFTPYENLPVMLGAEGGVLPTPLKPFTVYYFHEMSDGWHLSIEWNSPGPTADGGSGAAIAFENVGSGTLHLMSSGASWYPDLQAAVFTELHGVRSKSIVAMGTGNLAGGVFTKTSGPAFTNNQERCSIVIGGSNYQIQQVNGPTSVTVFPNTGTGTGLAFDLFAVTVDNVLIDSTKYDNAYEKMNTYAPSWWERPGVQVFPDMFAAAYAAEIRQDIVKASAKFDTLSGYYLQQHQPTNGLNNISEVGFARRVQNILVNSIGTGRNTIAPNAELRMRVLTALLHNSPTGIEQRVDGGITLSPSSEIIPITSAVDYTVTTVPTLSRGLDGQTAYLLNSSIKKITLTDKDTIAGTNLKLADSTVTLYPDNIIELKYVASRGYWTQVTTPLSLRDFVFAPSSVQALSAGTQILPSAPTVRISTASDILLTGTGTVVDGQDGQEIEIVNVDTHEITFQDFGTLSGSKLILLQGTITLQTWGSLRLKWIADAGMWLRVGIPNAKSVHHPELTVGSIDTKIDGDETTTLHGATVINGEIRVVTSMVLRFAPAANRFVYTDASRSVTFGLLDLSATSLMSNVLGLTKGGTGGFNQPSARTGLDVYGTAFIDSVLAAQASYNTAIQDDLNDEISRAEGVENDLYINLADKAGHGTYSVVGGGGGSVTI